MPEKSKVSETDRMMGDEKWNSRRSFVHLHLHSDHSMLDGLGTVEDYVARAKQLGHPALSLTDHGNVMGAPEFYWTCRENDIEPILGSEFYFTPDFEKSKKDKSTERFHVTVLAKNRRGFATLSELSTAANARYYYKPMLERSLLEGLTVKERENLVVLSGCAGSIISKKALGETEGDAWEEVRWWKDLFPNFRMELMHHDTAFDRKLNSRLVQMGQKLNIPWVITNDPHYVMKDECCPTGTIINTPSGDRKIEDLKVGDSVWGYCHLTKRVVVTKVAKVYARSGANNALFGNDRLQTTGGHPWWTENHGYVEVQTLRDRISSSAKNEQGTTAQILFAKMREAGAGSRSQQTIEKEDARSAFLGGSTSRRKTSVGARSINGASKKSSHSSDAARVSGGDESCSEKPLGLELLELQGGPDDKASRDSGKHVAEDVENGTRSAHWPISKKRFSLQTRLGSSSSQDRRRGGWPRPLWRKKAERCPEGPVAPRTRVVGLEIHKCGSTCGCKHSSEADQVFNIETGTGNYFAEKFLVHNCSTHDALLAIQTASDVDDPNRFRFDGEGYHLRSNREMQQAFSPYPRRIWEQGRKETLRIARSCHTRIPTWDVRSWHIPKWKGSTGETDSMKVLRRLTRQGLKDMGFDDNEEYVNRAKRELREFKQVVVERDSESGATVGMADFLLITRDAILAATEKGIRVGPGRGSVCSTLVGYLIGIHKVDPVKYDLLFERFLNPDAAGYNPQFPEL